MKQFLTATDHEITDGSVYEWSSYGPRARFINCDNALASAHIVFDTVTQDVYEIGVQTTDGQTNYRWMNPLYLDAYKAEAKKRGVEWNSPASIEENVRWMDTDTIEDICEKVHAIRNGIPYNPDVIMTLHLDREVICDMALMAHERGLTLNEFIVVALKYEIDRLNALDAEAKADAKAAKKAKKKKK